MEYKNHEAVPVQDMPAIISKFKKKLSKKESDD